MNATEIYEAKSFKAEKNHLVTSNESYKNLSKNSCIKNDQENIIRCYGHL